jgi:hypothetical protein
MVGGQQPLLFSTFFLKSLLDEIIESNKQLSPKFKNKRKNSILASTMALKKMRNT